MPACLIFSHIVGYRCCGCACRIRLIWSHGCGSRSVILFNSSVIFLPLRKKAGSGSDSVTETRIRSPTGISLIQNTVGIYIRPGTPGITTHSCVWVLKLFNPGGGLIDNSWACIFNRPLSRLYLTFISKIVLLQMGAEAASWLSQAAGLTAAQLELLAPYAASMLARPLAASNLYLDRPKVS